MTENVFQRVVLELRYSRDNDYNTWKKLYNSMGITETQGGRYYRGETSPAYAKAVEMYGKVGYELTLTKIVKPERPKKLTQINRPNKKLNG